VSTFLLPEAALRSLVMGAIIFAVMRLLRIDQVRARRTAWLLALAGALAMPLLVGAHLGPRLLPEITIAGLPAVEPPAAVNYERASASGSPADSASEPAAAARPAGYVISICAVGYCVVAAVLSLRLGAGVGFALRLRNQAQRLNLPFDPALDVRASARVRTPVTIASSVLLPVNYASWDPSTLRVVLAHERSHVRQRDFLVHVLAGLHCAIFWFNPFSWWLQRQLSELGEALSDHAAVDQAESRASYAEVLLAFAARVHWPFAGAAMASASNLTPRIERLLSDRGFERSFTSERRLPFIAAGVVMLAMAAATSMSRVDAALAGAQDPSASANSSPSTNPGDPAADESVLAVHTGKSRIVVDSAVRLPSHAGDYLYFQHDGKPYLIEDPSVIARAQALLEPAEDLGRQEREIGKQLSQLGAQQRELIHRQLAEIDSPEFRRKLEQLQNVANQVKLAQISPIDEKALAQLESHLAQIQARVEAVQGDLARGEGGFRDEESDLGQREGKLSEQMEQLAEQRRKIIEDVRRQLKPFVEQSIRDGKGKALIN
jgi:beta-lactamase regulating signal transducer with metallopeptidase domain